VCSRERDTDLEYYVFFTHPDDLIKSIQTKKKSLEDILHP
jgi:hypothetical protein